MKTLKLLTAVAAIALLFGACGQADHNHENGHEERVAHEEHEGHDHDAIDLSQARAELQAMEDAYAVMAYYADDAVSLPNNAPMASGKAAILKMTENEIASDDTNTTIAFEVVDVIASGDLAVEVGKSISKDADGNVVATGKYISVFEKRDGKYVCIRDTYNNDAPPAKEEG